MTKRVALYLRVSTGEQTTDNQRLELQAVAARSGWEVVAMFEDSGISGAKGRDQRPDFDKLLKAATSRKFDMIAAWSVDRLGRSLQDPIGFMNELRALGIDLHLHKQALDTSTPSGRAMFGMLSVFGEFEREMIRERVNAGLSRARSQGKVLGRPKASSKTEARILELRASGMGKIKIGKTLGVGTSVVQRVIAAARSS